MLNIYVINYKYYIIRHNFNYLKFFFSTYTKISVYRKHIMNKFQNKVIYISILNYYICSYIQLTTINYIMEFLQFNGKNMLFFKLSYISIKMCYRKRKNSN